MLVFIYFVFFYFSFDLFLFFFFFFFQAEDGIRDHCVTGVQTCALPISRTKSRRTKLSLRNSAVSNVSGLTIDQSALWAKTQILSPPRGSGPEEHPGRSEERRVGKECRSRWSPYQ